MSLAPVDIANLALVHLGDKPIGSLDDDTAAGTRDGRATIMRTYYDQARDETLQAHPWNFAVTRASLALLSAAPVWGYTKAYGLPGDYLRVLDTDLDRSWTWPCWTPGWDEPKGLWAIESVDIPQVSPAPPQPTPAVVCDAASLKIRYIRRVEDTARFTPRFVKALAYVLAAKAAYQITQSSAMEQAMTARAEAAFAEARLLDAQEQGQRFAVTRSLTTDVR